jgi:hypothetical protein
MPATTVTLYVRPRHLPGGGRPYLKPATGKNNRVRAEWAIYPGDRIEVPGFVVAMPHRFNAASAYRGREYKTLTFHAT